MSLGWNLRRWNFTSIREKNKLLSLKKGKGLAKGVITTPLLAKIGKVYADEPIPDVGLYIPTESSNN